MIHAPEPRLHCRFPLISSRNLTSACSFRQSFQLLAMVPQWRLGKNDTLPN